MSQICACTNKYFNLSFIHFDTLYVDILLFSEYIISYMYLYKCICCTNTSINV